MFRFEELEIWRLAVNYAKQCYTIASKFPEHERFSLQDQLRRAAISISNNIVEGSAGSSVNFKRYLNIAIGSTLETVNIVNFAYEVGYLEIKTRDLVYKEAEVLIRKTRSFVASLR